MFIFDDKDNLLCISSNTSQDSLMYWDAKFDEILNNASLFEFKIQPNHEWSQHIAERNQVAFKDKDGHLRLFKIVKVELNANPSGKYIRAICNDVVTELDLIFEDDLIFNNATAQAMLSRLLTRSRWSVGEVAQLGNKSLNLFNISVLQGLGRILKLFTGELRVRIEVENNRISRRVIDIVSRGTDTGLVLNLNRNVESLNMTIETEHIRTAIKPLGRSIAIDEEENVPEGYTRRTNIQGVSATMGTHGFDKEENSLWVEDHEARMLYGIPRGDTRQHLEQIVDFSNIEDQEELMVAGWNHLQTINQPRYYIEIDMIDLASLVGEDFSHEKLRLGDVVRLVDRESFTKPIVIESRVIRYTYDLTNPELTTVHLGNHRNLYSNDDRLLDLENQINNGSGIWSRPNISDNNIVNTPQPIVNLSALGLHSSININWDVQRLNITFELHASQVQGFTPSPANLIYRGRGNGFNHLVGTNQNWFYRVRATNVIGDFSEWSNEVNAQTARIISDDIFFGEDIARELRDLSQLHDIIGEDTIDHIHVKSAAIRTAHIQNLAVTRAHLQNALIGSAQIDLAVITDAHVHSLNADKIITGTLRTINLFGVNITGSFFRTDSPTSHVEIHQGRVDIRDEVNVLSGSLIQNRVEFRDRGNNLICGRYGRLHIAGDETAVLGSHIGASAAYDARITALNPATGLFASRVSTFGATGSSTNIWNLDLMNEMDTQGNNIRNEINTSFVGAGDVIIQAQKQFGVRTVRSTGYAINRHFTVESLANIANVGAGLVLRGQAGNCGIAFADNGTIWRQSNGTWAQL